MRKFEIRYNPAALKDIAESFEWGVRSWGPDAARKWFNDLEQTIESRLSLMPERCPLAPENSQFDLEVRHLIQGRYRILFTIKGDTVVIIYFRGPYSSGTD
ncbi:hypothetical protein BH10ACI3_BH10ACI3_05030 [soil metagenome]